MISQITNIKIHFLLENKIEYLFSKNAIIYKLINLLGDYIMFKKTISVLISSLCGSSVAVVAMLGTSYEQISFSNLIAGLILGLIYIIPVVIVLGIPSSILIDKIIKAIDKKYKQLIEIALYIIFGVIGATIVSLIMSLDDGINGVSFLGFEPVCILSLSCSIPFGICSVLWNYKLKKRPLQ